MEFSAAGLELLKKSEGFRARVYMDAAGVPTVGYGHRLLHPDSFKDGISEAEANDILTSDVRHAMQAMERLVKVPLTQGQYDALVDFTFNLGAGRLAGSTLLKLLNKRRYEQAAAELLLWDHAGAVELKALHERRKAEYELWSGEKA
jgi:lysozyme